MGNTNTVEYIGQAPLEGFSPVKESPRFSITSTPNTDFSAQENGHGSTRSTKTFFQAVPLSPLQPSNSNDSSRISPAQPLFTSENLDYNMRGKRNIYANNTPVKAAWIESDNSISRGGSGSINKENGPSLFDVNMSRMAASGRLRSPLSSGYTSGMTSTMTSNAASRNGSLRRNLYKQRRKKYRAPPPPGRRPSISESAGSQAIAKKKKKRAPSPPKPIVTTTMETNRDNSVQTGTINFSDEEVELIAPPAEFGDSLMDSGIEGLEDRSTPYHEIDSMEVKVHEENEIPIYSTVQKVKKNTFKESDETGIDMSGYSLADESNREQEQEKQNDEFSRSPSPVPPPPLPFTSGIDKLTDTNTDYEKPVSLPNTQTSSFEVQEPPATPLSTNNDEIVAEYDTDVLKDTRSVIPPAPPPPPLLALERTSQVKKFQDQLPDQVKPAEKIPEKVPEKVTTAKESIKLPDKVVQPERKKLMDSLHEEIVKAANERVKRPVKEPESKVFISSQQIFAKQLFEAFQARESRKVHGTLRFRNMYQSKVYRARIPTENTSSEVSTPRDKVDMMLDLANSQQKHKDLENGENEKDVPSASEGMTSSGFSINDKEWVPEHDIEDGTMDDNAEEEVILTARGTNYYDALSSTKADKSDKSDKSDVEKQFKKNKQVKSNAKKQRSIHRLKKSLQDAIGSIGRSFSKGKKKFHDLSKGEEGWEVFRMEKYDPPPDGPISIKSVILSPAYAYHPDKSQLMLLPDYDRVIITEDGRKILEADLLKIDKFKKSMKELSGNKERPGLAGLFADDKMSAWEKEVEEERKQQELMEVQFAHIRQLSKKLSSADDSQLPVPEDEYGASDNELTNSPEAQQSENYNAYSLDRYMSSKKKKGKYSKKSKSNNKHRQKVLLKGMNVYTQQQSSNNPVYSTDENDDTEDENNESDEDEEQSGILNDYDEVDQQIDEDSSVKLKDEDSGFQTELPIVNAPEQVEGSIEIHPPPNNIENNDAQTLSDGILPNNIDTQGIDLTRRYSSETSATLTAQSDIHTPSTENLAYFESSSSRGNLSSSDDLLYNSSSPLPKEQFSPVVMNTKGGGYQQIRGTQSEVNPYFSPMAPPRPACNSHPVLPAYTKMPVSPATSQALLSPVANLFPVAGSSLSGVNTQENGVRKQSMTSPIVVLNKSLIDSNKPNELTSGPNSAMLNRNTEPVVNLFSDDDNHTNQGDISSRPISPIPTVPIAMISPQPYKAKQAFRSVKSPMSAQPTSESNGYYKDINQSMPERESLLGNGPPSHMTQSLPNVLHTPEKETLLGRDQINGNVATHNGVVVIPPEMNGESIRPHTPMSCLSGTTVNTSIPSSLHSSMDRLNVQDSREQLNNKSTIVLDANNNPTSQEPQTNGMSSPDPSYIPDNIIQQYGHENLVAL